METRVIEQVKIYYLVMNPVTDRAESGRVAMMSTNKNRLLEVYQNEFVESYSDDRFHKVFRKNGPLEWYNPIYDMNGQDFFGHGLKEEWIEYQNLNQLRNQYYFVD